MKTISADKVKDRVEEFWQIMSGKSRARMEELYSASALVISGRGRSPEPAALAITRRKRSEVAASEDRAELDVVEVLVVGDVAIASYVYQFHRSRKDDLGGVVQRHTRHGRATQIFQLDEQGVLRIVHEHLSAATNPETQQSAKPGKSIRPDQGT
ncbi:MAG TPA: DUF4440 domain-containing protein [Candidatus Saccharimonadales bacterium]|jgi:ketosteroid isomerase-like protein|nr:DUF4440 domain-containing protein [Candidatus Saccharimonadales bacterium]